MAEAFEKITARILSQAETQAQEILHSAQEQAEATAANARAEANKRAEEILHKAQQDAKENSGRILSVADLSLRKQLLAQKRVVLDEAFEAAKKSFCANDDAFIKAYVKLVLEAVQTGDEEVVPAAADARRLNEGFMELVNEALKARGLPGNVSLLPPREDIPGGCIVASGGMEVDLSVNSVMQSVRERCEGEVASLLFAVVEG